MSQKIPEQNFYQEDEIDLKELFKILWAKKILIISITFIITLLAGIYAFNKTPIYEATALVEIGSYKFYNSVFINNNNNNNNKIMLENSQDLSLKINLLFPQVVSTNPKKNNSFINLKSEDISSADAQKNIEKVLSYINKSHGELLTKTKYELEKTQGNKVYNYKNSEIVGQITTSDYPIKPKKGLIMSVAFIAGFILSIFLVFIMNAFRKKEDKATA